MSRSSASSASILAITSQLPWPLTSGGHLRTYHLLSAIASRHVVRLVTPVQDGSDVGIGKLEKSGIHVDPVRCPARSWAGETRKMLTAAVSGRPYLMYERHHWPCVRRHLSSVQEEARADVVYLDHVDSFVYHDLLPDVPWVCDMHNVYAQIVLRLSKDGGRLPTRLYLRREARLLRRMEIRAAQTAAAVTVVSEEDRDWYVRAGARNVVCVPNGVDCRRLEAAVPARRGSAPTILFLGALSWPPNVSAAKNLATEIFPIIQRELPDARLQIVGRDPLPTVRDLNAVQGIEVLGNVADVRPFLASAHVMAVPLTSGGGTRLKILEAFAAGLPVVSTPVGCEGLGVNHREHLVIASTQEFATSLLQVLRDLDGAERMAKQARNLARMKFDWSIVGAEMCSCIDSLMNSEDASSKY